MADQGPIAADAAYDVGLRVKAGKRDHKCGQTRLTVVAETGEIQELGL